MSMHQHALRLRAVTKRFGLGDASVTALDHLDLEIAPGTLTAVMGQSGSGKSTLLHLAAGLDAPTSGDVVIGGTSLVGGKGSIIGTVIGALIISVLNNGLQIMSIPQEWQNVILGLVILVAVYADMARKRAA